MYCALTTTMRSHARVLVGAAAAALVACGTNPAPVQPTTPGATDAPVPGTETTAPAMPWAQSNIDWSAPPAPGPEPVFTPPTPEVLTLANGMSVILVENHRLPLISAVLVNRNGGTAHDPAGNEGLAALTADLLDEGAGKRSALEIGDALERLGASLSITASSDASELYMDTLAETLADSLALFGQIVTQPQFNKDDFARVQGDRLANLDLRPAQPRLVASLVFERILYGKHPYGAPGEGFAATMKKLSLAKVKAHYQSHYNPKDMVLVVAGDTNASVLKPLLETSFGKWRGGRSKPTVRKEPATSIAGRLIFVDKPDAAQSVVRIGRLALAQGDARYATATIANTVLGGSFASRLNNRLREVLGYTYGASSFFWFAREPGAWSVSTALKTDVTIEGIKEAMALIESMRVEPVPPAELDKAKQLRIRALPQEFETNAGAAGAFAELATYRQPLNWYTTLAAQLNAVTAEDAQAFATTWWNPADLRVVIVGDYAKLAPRLDELGFGAVLRYDAEGQPLN